MSGSSGNEGGSGGNGSGSGGGNSGSHSGGSGGGNSGNGNIQAEAEGASDTLADPYTYGIDDEEGKNRVYLNFGRVGGGETTNMGRMPSGSKPGVTKKHSITLVILRFGMELYSLIKDNPVDRAGYWACIITMMDRDRWGKLGQMSWNVDFEEYMKGVMRGLTLAPESREAYQVSCCHINNMSNKDCVSNAHILEQLMYCRWDISGLQLQAFESKLGFGLFYGLK
jgi:hypothetical protein